MMSAVAIAAALTACGGGGGDPTPASGGGPELAPAPVPAPAPATIATGDKAVEAAAFLTKTDQNVATAPAVVSDWYKLDDSCSKSNGFTKAYNVQYAQANSQQFTGSIQYRIGSTRTLIGVTADRSITNADGTTRRELDIKYKINFTDGSVDTDTTQTIVSGSSSGTCATPTASVDWRFLGNQQDVDVVINAANDRADSSRLSDGATFPSSTSTRRALEFGVQDVQGLYTYAVVSGPGVQTVTGVANPFSLKLISPRLLRDAPELAGKRGNYTNWTERNNFRACVVPAISANNSGPAPLADCVGAGAVGSSWGVTYFPNLTATSIATADAFFDAIGFQAGGVYTFAVYNDDGWKTINGQAGKTPVLTRTFTLQSLPYTQAEMLPASGPSKFPVGTSLTFSAGINISSVVNLAEPGSATGTWTPPPATFGDRAIFRLSEVGEFFEGINVATTAPATYPRHRYYTPLYPSSTATSISANITPTPNTIKSKTFYESSLQYTDRNNRRIRLLTQTQ